MTLFSRRNHFARTTALVPTLAIVLLGFAPSATASLLIDPSGGTVLISRSVGPADKDDAIVQGSRAINGSFFGTDVSGITPTINLNGNINFAGNGEYEDYAPGGLGVGTAVARIAPLFQDFYFRSGSIGAVIENATSSYYAVTWSNVEHRNWAGNYYTFQAVFIEQTISLHGLTFSSGDIVFSYANMSPIYNGSPPTIGLENSDASYVALPGTEGSAGVLTYQNESLLPDGDGQYLLFRPDGDGSYNASILTAVPEPSTYAALAGGFALAGALLRRRRR